jgi:RNA polymerase II subunit A C-terminal domain phosphatase SSU72
MWWHLRIAGYVTLLAKQLNNFVFFSKRGLLVRSYGSGQQVKLPGTSLEKPNVYTFDTPYEFMYKDLYSKDANLYV